MAIAGAGLDLRIEFLQAINLPRALRRIRTRKTGQSLARSDLLRSGWGRAAEKEQWRELILRGRTWTATEREGIRIVRIGRGALHQLLPAMVDAVRHLIALGFSLYRGRYMRP